MCQKTFCTQLIVEYLFNVICTIRQWKERDQMSKSFSDEMRSQVLCQKHLSFLI